MSAWRIKRLHREKHLHGQKKRKDKYSREEELLAEQGSKLRRELADLQTEHEDLPKHEKAREGKGVSQKRKESASIDKKKMQLEKKIAIAEAQA